MTAPFMDFEFETGSATLYPRPETELLVEKALEVILKVKEPNILDLGTGSGNIAISLTKYHHSSRIVALDISAEALLVARGNACKYGVEDRIRFIKSNLFGSIRGHFNNYFDIIISNPPYVALDEFRTLSESVKSDPYIALYGGRDGLDFYRRISEDGGGFLKKDGILLMEIGDSQAKDVKEIIEKRNSFYGTEIYKDYSGLDRIIKARKNG